MTAKQIPFAMSTTDATLRVPLPHGSTHPPVPQLPTTEGMIEGSCPALLSVDWKLAGC